MGRALTGSAFFVMVNGEGLKREATGNTPDVENTLQNCGKNVETGHRFVFIPTPRVQNRKSL